MTKFSDTKKAVLKITRAQSDRFDEDKKKFSESFEVNPIYAAEYHLERVVKSQVIHTIWFPISRIANKAKNLKELLDGVEAYYGDIKSGAINNVRVNSSSSQITNVKRAWEIEQTFDCIKEEFGTGFSSLSGLVKMLREESKGE